MEGAAGPVFHDAINTAVKNGKGRLAGKTDVLLAEPRWAACGQCDGERKRVREILVYPAKATSERRFRVPLRDKKPFWPGRQRMCPGGHGGSGRLPQPLRFGDLAATPFGRVHVSETSYPRSSHAPGKVGCRLSCTVPRMSERHDVSPDFLLWLKRS